MKIRPESPAAESSTARTVRALLLAVLLLLGAAPSASAQDCSDFPGGVLDGATGLVPPAQLQIDRNCTIRNYPASNPLRTNFSFLTQPGQTDDRWLIIFDNVVHTGQMACNAVAGHRIWFTNGSSTAIQEGCQNLLIPVEKIEKDIPAGPATAAIGVPFTYTLTMPVLFDAGTGTVIDGQGSLNDLHGVEMTDDLNETGVDVAYVSHVAYWRDTGDPVAHSFSNVGGVLRFDGFPIVPAGQQILIDLTVVLLDTPTNTIGTQFINTARWEFGRLIDDVFYQPLPGENGISDPLTISAPDLVMAKTGPVAPLGLNLGQWGTYTLDVTNAGLGDAWNVTLSDLLPNGATGGMCDTTPEILSARVFAADGVTPVPGKGPLVAGTDYTLVYDGAPSCELTLEMLTAAGTVAPGERLIVTYRARLDADTQDSATLTNVAGATRWYNDDPSNLARVAFLRSLTNGTVGVADHEDAHDTLVALFGHFFEKTVANLTTGVSPAATAAPGDTLRYTLRLQATDSDFLDMTFVDDLGARNPGGAFVPGSLALVPGSVPPGADASNTDPNGGTGGMGSVDVRGLDAPAGGEVSIQFDVTVDGSLADGSVVVNQSTLATTIPPTPSDDPNVNGQADPAIPGDEDPTRVVIEERMPDPPLKATTQATATIGEEFDYRITLPAAGHTAPIFDVQIDDDLGLVAADVALVSITKISAGGAWTPVDTGSGSQVRIEDPTVGIDVPAGEQIVIDVRLRLLDTSTNIAGLSFTNTASYSYNLVDGDEASRRPGGSVTSGPMTVVEPDLTLTKRGPTQMRVGVAETFTLDVQNAGASPAHAVEIQDLLPNQADGGMCDAAPTAITARLFESDGTTPAGPALAAGTDFTVAFDGDPTCVLTLSFSSAAAVVDPGRRLIVTYDAQLDAGTLPTASLTNVGAATLWHSGDPAAPGAAPRAYPRTATDGTVGTLDHEDAHTVGVQSIDVLFEKSVANLTRGVDPASLASPGERLLYRLRVENQGTQPITDFAISDELDRLNASPAFAPGSLTLVSAPFGADTSNTDPNGGASGTGLVDVRGLSLAGAGDDLTIEFEVVLAPVLANASVVANQSQLLLAGGVFEESDDPAQPGASDPTRITIESTSAFRVEKVSSDLTGDPSVLLAGETLRYTIEVENVGNADVTDATLRDAVPINTTYVPGSTALNGAPVTDGPGGASPLASGIPIHAPVDPTPGVLLAGGAAANVATIVFDVVVDPGVADGTVISNQGFASALLGGIVDRPSDDPTTPLVDDPTRDVVGNAPLLFATKSVVIGTDNGTPGVVDPLDVLHYTITVLNTGNIAASAAVLSDPVPANTTWQTNSLLLNGLPVGVPDGGTSPLAGGIGIASSDETPPLPGPAGGTLSPGESATIEFDLQVDAGVPGGTLISNQAIVSTAELPNLLTDGDGNPATGPEPTVVVVGAGQQLAISKLVSVVGGGPALAGSRLEYEVRVTNVGTVDALNVVITDDVDPAVLAYVPGSATLDGVAGDVAVAGTLLTADYSAANGPLPVGTTTVLRFRADVDGGLVDGDRITNVGVVAWNAPPQTENASVSIDVGGTPGAAGLNGTAWHDENFDDVLDGGETLLTGWTVELLRGGIGGTPVQSALTDVAGAWSLTGVAPNDLNGEIYALRFTAPSAGPNTAPLGRTASPFTNGLQQITDLVVAGGANLQNLDLPIDPNGVVYDSLGRTPVAGATLTLLANGSGIALPGGCFEESVQQGQITRADGFYKFDLVFGDPGCPSPGGYEIAIAMPAGGAYETGPSQIVPPVSDPLNPIDVPTCPGDAITTTTQHCEAQAFATAPSLGFLPGSPETDHYLHLTLDASASPGSSQLFNNHLPVDPVIAGNIAITKTTPSTEVSRGDLVPYEIVVRNQLAGPIPQLSVVDRYPAGFHYVEGSARVDGNPFQPTHDPAAREVSLANVGVPGAGSTRVLLLLAVGAGVGDGRFTNIAYAENSFDGTRLSGDAAASVRVAPDPDFDCTDVMGKVFDDRDRDGTQAGGERGLAGVRVVTARGLVATTDAHGRFHITCAVVPNEDRGSNFILKLDERTLPSGYRMSTRTTQVKRATAGKALYFDFGASVHRVVGLDLVDAVFEPGSTEMRGQWLPRLEQLVQELEGSPASARLAYVGDLEEPELVERRLAAVEAELGRRWLERHDEPLTVETEVFWRRGAPVSGTLPNRLGGALVDALTSPFRSAATRREAPGEATERHLDPARLTTWAQDPERLAEERGDRIERREVKTREAETVKLEGVVPPIRFASGAADIPPESVAQLRRVLDEVRHRDNVRLHLLGHADDRPLRPALAAIHGDNEGLSHARAAEVAEYLQAALGLPPESISFAYAGAREPLASNATEAGRARNRRVEVQVWYDEPRQGSALEDAVVNDETKRVPVCRVQTVCKLSYREGERHRTRLRNLIAPLQLTEGTPHVSDDFVRQVGDALENLGDRTDVTVRFIGHTDDAPLEERTARIYGTHLAVSKARAHRVARTIQDRLQLPSSAVESEGRGSAHPAASNASERGRASNRRVEVEFWYDDPLQELPDEPQPCPDPGDAEWVTRVYHPTWGRIEAIAVEDGELRVPAGHADLLRRALDDAAHELPEARDLRLRFVGYTANARLDRRTAAVYGDDVGLATARARRALEQVLPLVGRPDLAAEHEGRGYVHSNDVVNAGFLQGETDHVLVQVVYDTPRESEALDGIDVTPLVRELRPQHPLALNPMHITVDGIPIDDPDRSSADVQRCTDVALDAADIRFEFDALEVTPRLSVTAQPGAAIADGTPQAAVQTVVAAAEATDPPAEAEEPGENTGPGTAGTPASEGGVRFRMYTNYPHFIERSEVRIFERGSSTKSEPLAVLPVDTSGAAQWNPEAGLARTPARELVFVLRAYDAEGRFDETAPQGLWLLPAGSDPGAPAGATGGSAGLLAGYGETGALARGIPLAGAGRVRVHGEGIPAGHQVWLAGEPVPTDAEGRFVAEAVLPHGAHSVEVAVLDAEGGGELFLRDAEIDRDDWFYVGIADLTLSGGFGDSTPDAMLGDGATRDPDSHADGRLAFFVKGRFGEGWGLTAHVDTREGPVEDLFRDFVDKTPEAAFRRIDSDEHYPTFGDDGTVEEGAPTSGKFYVKLSKDDSFALWGNFEVDYLGNELAQVDRSLYGANLHYESVDATSFGERKIVLDGYAAQPGTVPSREDFRGTGGSLYYLRVQNLLEGSERLRVETRDHDSGLVTSVVHLRHGVDYDIDYLQGRVLLSEPLSATSGDGTLVRTGGLDGDEVWLVAQYEYTPGLDELDALAFGGQGHVWIGDSLRLGATANRNDDDTDVANLYAGDVTLRESAETWLKLQVARSEGPVAGALRSDDGGFSFSDPTPAVPLDAEANAYRADGSVGFADVLPEGWGRGRLSLYAQLLDAGYSAPGLLALDDTQQYGARLDLPISEQLEIVGKADRRDQRNGLDTTAAELDAIVEIGRAWSLGAGVRYDRRRDASPLVPLTQDEGSRTDGVVQLGYDSRGRWDAYAFGQATLARSGGRESNERYGAGGSVRVGDRMIVEGEVSHGESGPALQLGTRFQQSESSHRYLSYALENERGVDGVHQRRGRLVSGAKARFADSGSVFVEDRYQHTGAQRGLSRAVGVTFAEPEHWSLSASWELGTLVDRDTHAETERRAGSLSAGYRFDDLQLAGGVEYRNDDAEQLDGTTTERTTWLFKSSLRYQMSPDWRLLGKLNHSFSDSSEGAFFDGGYTEAVTGFAFRPVDHDRLNALAKYTWFSNTPTTGQIGNQGNAAEFAQRSHVASLDVDYDLTSKWSVGGKYAFRRGEVSLDRVDPLFFKNDAHLWVLRSDYRFLKDWEALVEGRTLHLPQLSERRSGALLSLSRYLGENFKVGAGYNFTDFSDDLTDLGRNHHGFFLNITGAL